MDLNVQPGRTGGATLARRAYANDRRSLPWGLSGLVDKSAVVLVQW